MEKKKAARRNVGGLSEGYSRSESPPPPSVATKASDAAGSRPAERSSFAAEIPGDSTRSTAAKRSAHDVPTERTPGAAKHRAPKKAAGGTPHPNPPPHEYMEGGDQTGGREKKKAAPSDAPRRPGRPAVEKPAEDGIGAIIRTRRDSLAMSQEELAAYSGVSASAIYKIEMGQMSPTWGTLEPLFAALNLEVRIEPRKRKRIGNPPP